MTTPLDRFSIPPTARDAHRALLRDLAEPNRRRGRRRLLVVAVAISAFVAAPALAVVAVWPPWAEPPTSPEEAARQTGKPVASKLDVTVDGVTWRFYAYRDASGELCTGEKSNAHDTDTPSEGYGCQTSTVGPLFPAGPLRVYGPEMSRNASSPADRWDRVWLHGLAKPGVAHVAIRLTDCRSRDAAVARDAFEGAMVFAYVEPQELVHRNVLPLEAEARDAAGRVVATERLHADMLPNGKLRPRVRCR